MTTTANIAAKGCNGTGITEDLAQTLHNQLGKKVLAVVELVAETRSEKRNGDEKVVLSILTLEPAPNGMTEDHLRELARSFYYERQLADGQLKIETGDDIEPKVADVLAAGAQHRPHEHLPIDDGVDDTCDLCGQDKDAAIHAEKARIADPFTVVTDDDDDEPEAHHDNELDLDNEDTPVPA